MAVVHDALRKVPLFADLDNKALERLENFARERTYEAGSDIVRQGDEGVGVFVILEGKAEALRDGQKLAEFGPSSFFGEMAILDHYRRSATVRAVEATKCLAIPRSDFLAELRGNNDLCLKLLVHMSRRVRDLDEALTTE